MPKKPSTAVAPIFAARMPKVKVRKVVVTVVLDIDASVALPPKKAIEAHVKVALRRHDFYTARHDLPGYGPPVDIQTGLAVVDSRVRSVDFD